MRDNEKEEWANDSRPADWKASHYTPDMYLADSVKGRWNATAEVHSLNSGDTEPQHHPLGFTLAQLNHNIGPDYHGVTTWNNGNGGGNEKMDIWEHIAEENKGTGNFANVARVPYLKSLNQNDAEPSGHPMGYSFAQAEGPIGPDYHGITTWDNGNRGGSEKMDTFDHISEEQRQQGTKNFDKIARVPYLRSLNTDDVEPTGHPMGYTFSQKRMGPNNKYESTWTDGNGAGSEKVDYWSHLSYENKGNADKFHHEAAAPWLTASNSGDAEAKHHPMGMTAQKEKTWSGDYWHHLNNDHKGDKFHEEAAYKPVMEAGNREHKEPTYHNNGFVNSQISNKKFVYHHH